MPLKQTSILLTLIVIGSLQIGCSGIETRTPEDAYRYWAGENPSPEVSLIDGQYWQSSHWSKEYIVYLKLKATTNWWNAFISHNALVQAKDKWIRPADAPLWFNPANHFLAFSQNDLAQNSRYFRDTATGICYIYEIQL